MKTQKVNYRKCSRQKVYRIIVLLCLFLLTVYNWVCSMECDRTGLKSKRQTDSAGQQTKLFIFKFIFVLLVFHYRSWMLVLVPSGCLWSSSSLLSISHRQTTSCCAQKAVKTILLSGKKTVNPLQ